jgi:hypothetical protein
MKQVTYAGTTFITGSDIADALIVLATALVRNGGAAAVRIPALYEDDEVRSLDLVMGPMSSFVAIELRPTDDELFDPECVRVLGDQSRAVLAPRTVTAVEVLPAGWADPDLDDVLHQR